MDQNDVTANDTGNEEVTTSNLEEIQDEPIPSSDETSPQAELPEGVSERTQREFEKLKKANVELAKKLAEREREQTIGNSVYDKLLPNVDTKHLTTNQVQNIKQNFVDEEGNVDVYGLQDALREANQRALKAEQVVNSFIETQRKSEEQKQLKEAYKVSPWLDPNARDFDQKKFNLTQDRLIRYWTQGKNPDLVSVAKEIEEELGSFSTPERVEQEKAKAVEQVRDDISRRNAVSNVATNRPKQTETSLEELKTRTRNGDNQALMERLKGI